MHSTQVSRVQDFYKSAYLTLSFDRVTSTLGLEKKSEHSITGLEQWKKCFKIVVPES